MDPESFKIHLKESALGVEKKNKIMFSVYFQDDQSGVCVGSVAAAAPGHSRQDDFVPCSVFPFVCLDFQLMSRKVLIHTWHNTALISAADARCCRNTKK